LTEETKVLINNLFNPHPLFCAEMMTVVLGDEGSLPSCYERLYINTFV